MSLTQPASTAVPRSEGIHWMKSLPFFAVHAIALATPFFAPIAWKWVLLAVGSYYVRMFALTAGYHRYFSHRSYRAGRGFQLFLAVLGCACTQKGPLWWAAHHRDHHRYSDRPEDIHSPVQRGFWWSHVGWVLSNRYEETKLERIRDFARFPELRWLDRWNLLPAVLYAAALYFLGGRPALLWGYFVSTTLLWHGTFVINSLAHVFGRKRYETGDESRNSFLLAVVTMGEGWHNNHHFYQSSANQGFYWWELDLSYYVLRALEAVGFVHEVRTPPRKVRDSHCLPASERRSVTPDSPAGLALP